MLNTVLPSPTCARSSAAMRLLPMPGSPTSSTAWPWPAPARAQRSSSSAVSASRLTSGVSRAPCAAAKRPSARPAPSTRHTPMGWAMPLSVCLPQSSHSKASATRRRVVAATRIWSGSASACTRAATLGVAPIAVLGKDASPPPVSPTTTAPVAMPMRTRSGRTVATALTASTISSAVSKARWAASSWARGQPKYTISPSPRYCATCPAWRSTAAPQICW